MKSVIAKKTKRVLITAGPTWVKIDAVRVLANIATGLTGITLAQKLAKRHLKVTLLLGPVQSTFKDKKIKVMRYRFFEELKELLKKELKTNDYDWAVHCAAVADYKPQSPRCGKIKSALKTWRLTLVPTEKLAKLFKKIQPKIKLAIFKLEYAVKPDTLLKRTQLAMQRYAADLGVGNTFLKNKYFAYIIKNKRLLAQAKSREDLAEKLSKIIL